MPVSFMSRWKGDLLSCFMAVCFQIGQNRRFPELQSDDVGGSFAAGRAHKSLSLPGRFCNPSMEKPAGMDTLVDYVGRL